jgi:hypothetical protein
MVRIVLAIAAIALSLTGGAVVASPTAQADCGPGDYTNSNGNCVQDPTQAPTAPPGATAQCRDGDWSFSQHHSGTCSGHGGVAQWLGASSTPPVAAPLVANVGAAMPAANTPDGEFYWLLTDTEDNSNPMVIWNFPLVKAQGLAACQRMDNGETPYQATTDLEAPAGPYTFDDASSITSSATVIYCPWHNAPLPPS